MRVASATWTCGHCETNVELQVLERLCALPETKTYRVLELRPADASNSDSFGGSMPMAEQKLSSPSDTVKEPQAGERGLVLQKQCLDLILQKKKTVELRDKSAKLGMVWLTHKTQIFAHATVTRCEELTVENFRLLREQHCVQTPDPPYKTTYGLWLQDVSLLPEPKAFRKLPGQVGWVRLRFDTCAHSQMVSSDKKVQYAGWKGFRRMPLRGFSKLVAVKTQKEMAPARCTQPSDLLMRSFS